MKKLKYLWHMFMVPFAALFALIPEFISEQKGFDKVFVIAGLSTVPLGFIAAGFAFHAHFFPPDHAKLKKRPASTIEAVEMHLLEAQKHLADKKQIAGQRHVSQALIRLEDLEESENTKVLFLRAKILSSKFRKLAGRGDQARWALKSALEFAKMHGLTESTEGKEIVDLLKVHE